ncbi:MAG: TonB-dependent receptor [Synechococcus sp. SB0677_bin_5]|nr:TonB-dependent receptor [Synechococcus sp. SB0677_bin_5]
MTGDPVLVNVQRPVLIYNTFEPNPDLKSEKATQIEIGTRYQHSNVAAAEDQLFLSANAYYSTVDNYIEAFFPAFEDRDPDLFITNNEGKSTRNVNAVLYGLEAKMSYDTEYWFTSANLTIPRGNNKDSSDQLVNIPQDRVSVTVGLKPNPQWKIGVRSTVAGERDVNDEDGDDTDGFVTFDLFAILQLGDDSSSGTLISFGIDNITNQKYKLYTNGLNSSGRSIKLNTRFTF